MMDWSQYQEDEGARQIKILRRLQKDVDSGEITAAEAIAKAGDEGIFFESTPLKSLSLAGMIPQLEYDDSKTRSDLEKLTKQLKVLPNTIINDMLKKGVAYMQRRTKVDVWVKDDSIVGDNPQLIYDNYGTKPHIIKAKPGHVLRFIPAGSSTTVFCTVVHHPGTKSKNFIQKTEDYIIKEANNYVIK